ncbi:MAG: DUF4111 domain-containing protein [Clostridia bacterium]|nr:DUF4111 domain-containing protein [Clostridia bacterium]
MITRTLDLSGVTPLNRTQIEHLVHLSGDFVSKIIFEHKNRTINGKSMLGLLSMGETGKDPVTLIVDGEDEEEACTAITEMLKAGVVPPKSAVDAQQLMQRIKDRYVTILGDNLVGIYLHGSLASGCFRWDGSDIDFLVVAKKPLSLDKKIALVEALHALESEAPPKGLEMSVILEKNCRDIPCPVPFEIHYSSGHREEYERDGRGFCARMHGEDPDLTAHILCVNAFGEVICGPGITRVFDQVKKEDALRAILFDVEDAQDQLHENPVYYVLNLCRAVAYKREDLVLSKREGGEWALRHMPSVHQQVIQAALNAYNTGLGMFYNKGEAEAFRFDAMKELKE